MGDTHRRYHFLEYLVFPLAICLQIFDLIIEFLDNNVELEFLDFEVPQFEACVVFKVVHNRNHELAPFALVYDRLWWQFAQLLHERLLDVRQYHGFTQRNFIVIFLLDPVEDAVGLGHHSPE